MPVVDRRRPGLGHQQGTHGRPAEAVEPQRAVGFDDVGVRADPVGLAVARGEVPFAGDSIAARCCDRLVMVGRAPGDEAARIGIDRARRLEWNERRYQSRAVGDEHVPADRPVEPRNLGNGVEIDPRLDLIAADRTRQQHAEQPRFVQRRQHRLRNLLRALDLVGHAGDRRPQRAGAGDGIGLAG